MDREIRVLFVGGDGRGSTAASLATADDRFAVVTESRSGDALDRLAGDGPIDCVVSAQVLPETDGLAFLERVRDAHPDLPVVLLAADGSESLASDAIAAGVTDYVPRGDGAIDRLADRIPEAVARYRETRRASTRERLIDAADAGTFRAAPDGRILDADDELAGLSGADSAADLVGRSIGDLCPETVICDRLDDDETAFSEEAVPFRTLDGDERWAALTVCRTETPEGVRIEGLVRDVTARRERDRDLRLFREAIEASGHSVYFTDRDGTITYVNPAFEATTGYAASEAIGQTPRILKSEVHDRDFYERLWDTILSGDVWRNEIVNKTKSGRQYVVDQTIAPVEGDSGKIERFVAVNADITQQKAREEQLDRSRERLRALFEHSPDAVLVHTLDGSIVDVNRQAVESLGYGRQELLSMNVTEIEAHHDPETLRKTWERVAAGERVEATARHRRADGSTFPTEVWLTKIELDEEPRIVAFSRDVTERHEYEEELQRQIDRLEQFATVVSHDLRNPLNVATGRLDLLREEVESDHLDVAVDALDRMEELIEDLLVLAREGGQATDADAIDLAGLAGDCWRTVSTAEATLDIRTDERIRADRPRLQQLLENLIRNAIEHGGSDITLTVGDLPGGFYVEDDGPGIPPDEREHVFETGYSTAEEGTGLGLNIVRQVAEAHGWDVTITESGAGGARFEITGVETFEKTAESDPV
ncbi:PAS domain S-box protein [Halobellus rubicundus]|uniref:histidine kinase n=1 Tax=Halobellus rubicundus TaxID=2996466 RepID=A0ABD5MAG6_9EURY